MSDQRSFVDYLKEAATESNRAAGVLVVTPQQLAAQIRTMYVQYLAALVNKDSDKTTVKIDWGGVKL